MDEEDDKGSDKGKTKIKKIKVWDGWGERKKR